MNNFANNYFDYIGATGEYTISDYIDITSNNNFIYTSNTSNYLNKRIDDIDIETSNISSNISSYYTQGLRNELWEVNPNNSKCLIKSITDYNNNIHTHIINSNAYGEIRFTNIYTGNDPRVIIDKFGKLNVYHIYDILKPTISAGWKDVEAEITNLILLSQINGAEIIVVQGQIAGIDASIEFILGELTTLSAYNRAINLNLETLSYGKFDKTVYDKLVEGSFTEITGQYATKINEFSTIAVSTRVSQFTTGIAVPTAVAGIIGSIMYAIDMANIHNLTSNALNTNSNLTASQIIEILESSSNLIKDNYNSYNSNFCNMSLFQGFINSNITTTQFIPSLKSNKIMLGNITTPNGAYQMEMTGDLNLNMLYLNSTSLTSLLNQKQGNLTFTQPLYNTTNTIGLNYDSSLTLNANSLSVVKTASLPLTISANNWALNYDSSLTLNANSLSVVKTASLPLTISASHNFSLNYDSTLELSGNNLKVASGSASKWTTSGTNIYNNNSGFVGIGNPEPIAPLTIGTSKILGVVSDGHLIIGKTNGAGANRQFKIGYDNDFYFSLGDFGSGNIISATWTKQMSVHYDAPNYSFRVLNNGNVGIGFSTPQQKLSVNGITEICNDNSTKLIFSYNTANICRHSILTSHNSGSDLNNHFDFFCWRYGQSVTTLGDRLLLRLAATYTSFYGNKYFWINDKTIDSGNKNYTLTPLSVFNQTASSSSVLNDPQPVLNLARQGTAGQAYGQNVCFKICRWENNATNSRTRLDIDLSDGANEDTNIISLRSDGRVSFNTGKLYLATQIIQDYLFNCSGRNHASFTDFNSPTDFGVHFIVGTTNSPNVNGATEYYSWSMGLGANYTNIKAQFAIGRNIGNPYLCVRYNESGSWGSWYKLSCGLADNASSATFRIRSPSQSTSASLDLGTPFNSSAVNKCSIIAQGISSYSRSDLHICLNNTADNTTQATVSDARITIKPTGNIGFGNTIVPTQETSATSYFLHLGNSQSARTEDWNVCFHKSTGNGGTRMFNIGYTGDGSYNFYECLGDIGNNNTLGEWMYHLAIVYSAPDYCCIINNGGDMTLHGQFYPYSDEKIKTDIEIVDYALDLVCDLRGVYYTDIIHQERKIGLIAQEIELVLPELVITEKLTDTKAVNYDGLTAVLINAIKELKEIVDNQQIKINELSGIISRNGLS